MSRFGQWGQTDIHQRHVFRHPFLPVIGLEFDLPILLAQAVYDRGEYFGKHTLQISYIQEWKKRILTSTVEGARYFDRTLCNVAVSLTSISAYGRGPGFSGAASQSISCTLAPVFDPFLKHSED